MSESTIPEHILRRKNFRNLLNEPPFFRLKVVAFAGMLRRGDHRVLAAYGLAVVLDLRDAGRRLASSLLERPRDR